MEATADLNLMGELCAREAQLAAHARAVNEAARRSCPEAFNPCMIADPPIGPGLHIQEATTFEYFLFYVGLLCAGLGAGVIVAVASYALYRLGYFLTR